MSDKRRVQAGRLFERSRSKAERVARGVLDETEEARDVASDAFVTYLERGPEDADHADAWLMTTVRNSALNRARTQRRNAARMRSLHEPTAVDREPLDAATTGLLWKAFARLSQQDRDLIMLRFVEELDIAGVASRLRATPSRTRLHLYRARRRFRKQIVFALADHHGVSSACARLAIAGAPHRRCSACEIVNVELESLRHATPALLPAALLLKRPTHSIQEGIARATRGTSQHMGWVSDGIAMAVVATFAAVSALHPIGATAATPTSVSASTVRTVTSMRSHAAEGIRGATNGSAGPKDSPQVVEPTVVASPFPLPVCVAARVCVGDPHYPPPQPDTAHPVLVDQHYDVTNPNESSPAVDIFECDIRLADSELVFTTHVAHLASQEGGPETEFWYIMYFGYADYSAEVTARRTAHGANSFTMTINKKDEEGIIAAGTGSFDFATDTVTVTIPLTEVNAYIAKFGSDAIGQGSKFTNIAAQSAASEIWVRYWSPVDPLDRATPEGRSYVLGS